MQKFNINCKYKYKEGETPDICMDLYTTMKMKFLLLLFDKSKQSTTFTFSNWICVEFVCTTNGALNIIIKFL